MCKQRSSPSELEIELYINHAESVRKELKHLYGDLPAEFLWNTDKVQILVQPTLFFSLARDRCFEFVGRSRAKELLQSIQSLQQQQGRVLQVQGAQGSGKSTVISAIVGYLIGSRLELEDQLVVYICASRFIDNPLQVLRHALLVAGGSEHLASCSWENIASWCVSKRIIFVVDEWDFLEKSLESEKQLMQIVGHHSLVRVVSMNSRACRMNVADDKCLSTVEFGGPYTPSELATWISQSQLSDPALQALDWLTGGMPGLLRFYEKVGGDEDEYLRKVQEPYLSKLCSSITAIKYPYQFQDALRLVVSGERFALRNIDLTCFYLDADRKLRILSPCFRKKAEGYIMDQYRIMQSALNFDPIIRVWTKSIRLDMLQNRIDRTHIEWNVEGLVICAMRYQGKVIDGLEFKHYGYYNRGGELDAVSKFKFWDLEDGVFLAPTVLNKKAVDTIHIKLKKDTVIFTAVRISVSPWTREHRNMYMSLKVWLRQWKPKALGEMVQKWELQSKYKVRQAYICIVPEKVKMEEEYEKQNAEGEQPIFRTFIDVHPDLVGLIHDRKEENKHN